MSTIARSAFYWGNIAWVRALLLWSASRDIQGTLVMLELPVLQQEMITGSVAWSIYALRSNTRS